MIRSLRRRQLLAGAAGLLPLALRAQPAGTVAWTDVRLLDGRVLHAAELAQRQVIVYMWASWCPFCAKQSPHMQALHAEQSRRPDGLLVLGYSIDKTEKAAADYLARHGYTFAAAMATPQVEQWFGKRRALPEVYVVDRGRIVFREGGEMFPEDVAALARFARR
jgi:thiol-disulfide isomerase/thioredoxin